MQNINIAANICRISFVIICGWFMAHAQTTEFPYQGSLNERGGSPVNGVFDFELRLFDASTGGTLIGAQQRLNVTVTNSIFSVVLNFGEFPSENRFVEIGIREVGGTTFTTLAHRNKLLSTPYSTQARNAENAVNAENALNAQTAVNSTNSTNAQNAETAQNALRLDGTPANQFVLGNDPRLGDSRTPVPGSPSYVQNGTTQQAASNFNVSGNGTAGGTLTGNVVNAATHFTIGGVPILKNPGSFNFFAGPGASIGTTGSRNSFFGVNAGLRNETGSNNSFFGSSSGFSIETGSSNSFFGRGAGESNATASGNSFFGDLAGNSNITGANNAFFGFESGRLNEGSDNSFFGYEAGESNTSGYNNSFFGKDAGRRNTTGNFNSFFGYGTGEENTTGYRNSSFGSLSGASTTTGIQNSFFGSSSGVLTTDGSSNTMMGAWAGEWNRTGNYNTLVGVFAGNANETGDENTSVGAFADVGGPNLTNTTAIGAYAYATRNDSLVLGSIANVNRALRDTNVGIGTTAPLDRLHVRGVVRVETLGNAGSTGLCRNTLNQISTCSSSLRYKTLITPFLSGLDIVNRLRPISFNWKDGGERDLGLGAEEVAAIEPLLVTRDEKNEIEGVKYDRLAIVLLNAIREQQTQLTKQQKQIDELKRVVCSLNSTVAGCYANK